MVERLFNPSTLADACGKVRITAAQRAAADKWLEILGSGELAEQNNYLRFAAIVMQDILGYDIEKIEYEEDRIEFTYSSRGKKTVCFEAKGTGIGDLFSPQGGRRPEHATPIKQTWDHMGRLGLDYGVCTNYRRFVLITKEHGYNRCHQFDFESASDDEKLREFIAVFSAESTLGRQVMRLRRMSVEHDEEITSEFYDLYHRTRLLLVEEFERHLPEGRRGDAVDHAQVFLNRLLFVFFTEDTGLVGNGDGIFVRWVLGAMGEGISEETDRVWTCITREIFAGYERGRKKPRIFGFNGGLFRDAFPGELSIRDCVREEESGSQAARTPKGVWEFKEEIRDAVGRHPLLNPIIKHVLALSSYDFESQIRVSIMGHIFEQSISDLEHMRGRKKTERKANAVYYTPEYIVEYICRNTILPYISKSGTATEREDVVREYLEAGDLKSLEKKIEEVRILDPACGSGAFLIGAVNTLMGVYETVQAYKRMLDPGYDASGGSRRTLSVYLDEGRVRSMVRNNIFGIDRNRQSVEITRLSIFLITATQTERLPELGDNIVAGDSMTGEISPGVDRMRREMKEGFDIIIGNPPYIRQESMAAEYKDAIQITEGNSLNAGEMDRRMDLSGYFFLHSLDILRDGGMLGFIASESWMDLEMGAGLRQVVLDNSEIASIMRTAFPVFRDADVRTATTILRKNVRGGAGGQVALLTAATEDEVYASKFRNRKDAAQGGLGAGSWLRSFEGDMPRPVIGMTRMADIGTVKRGITTGRNEFFVISKETARTYKIGRKYLAPKLRDGQPSGPAGAPSEYLLCVGDSVEELEARKGAGGVLEYITESAGEVVTPKKGISREDVFLPELKTLSKRRNWYSLNLDSTCEIIISRFVYDRVKVYRNSDGVYATDNFAYFSPVNSGHTGAILAYLASSWFALYMEKNGIVAGRGALQFHICHFGEAPVPDLGAMKEADVRDLGEAWSRYEGDGDQEELDRVVLGIMGFGPKEQKSISAEHARRSGCRAAGR